MLKGKRALVTGCKRGIGKAEAITLARYGADIVLNDLIITEQDEVTIEVKKLGRKAICIGADITDPDAVAGMFDRVKREWDGLDIIVNNAGITDDSISYKMNVDQWKRVLDVNITGTFLCAQAAAKLMIEVGSGKIINTSSQVAYYGNIGQANYVASKGAVISLTKNLARELAKKGINVNAVAPGLIKTIMTDAIPDKIREQKIANIPLLRAGTPQDIANTVLFLASPLSDYITGQTILVNGGTYM